MVHESLRNLRLDRRLLHRRGWIADEERERELSTLPDVTEKIAPPEQELERDAAASGASTEPPGDAGV